MLIRVRRRSKVNARAVRVRPPASRLTLPPTYERLLPVEACGPSGLRASTFLRAFHAYRTWSSRWPVESPAPSSGACSRPRGRTRADDAPYKQEVGGSIPSPPKEEGPGNRAFLVPACLARDVADRAVRESCESWVAR